MEGEELEPVEWDVMENPLTEVIPIAPANGYVKIPTGTGLGIELDMDLLHRFRWDGSVYR
jgi:D-galactarolactone cycloisomerase